MNQTSNESVDLLATADRAAWAAAEILLEKWGNAAVEYKADQTQNLVTEADLAAEACVLKVIQEAYPNHDIMGEEGLSSGSLSSTSLWVVDPLDGTTNYSSGIPQFAVSIAFAKNGRTEVGVVVDPCRNETFHAVRGGGAYLNKQPIRVSNRKEMHEGVFAMGFYYDRGEMMEKTLLAIQKLFQQQNIRGIRRLGSAALDLCWVACGRMDGFFEYQLSPWDYAAASLIIEEAGGRCADRDGEPLRLGSGSVITASDVLFGALVDQVRW